MKAKDVKCAEPKCKNMAFRFISVDVDIKPIPLCPKHLMKLYGDSK